MTEHVNLLVHCDCLNLVERLPADSAGLVYLDPPWGTRFAFPAVPFPGLEDAAEPEQVCTADAYWDLMSKVVQQSHRILSNTGVLLWHLDPRLSAQARVAMDQVFGTGGYQTEIVLPSSFRGVHGRPHRQNRHTILLVYSKTGDFPYNPPTRALTSDEVSSKNPQVDSAGAYRLRSVMLGSAGSRNRFVWKGITPPDGRSWRYPLQVLDELAAAGRIVVGPSGDPKEKVYPATRAEIDNIWDDLPPASATRGPSEYPVHESVALLKRALECFSTPGALVVDPFCGTGTTPVAASLAGRRWYACDKSGVAIKLCCKRLQEKLDAAAAPAFALLSSEEFVERFPSRHATYEVRAPVLAEKEHLDPAKPVEVPSMGVGTAPVLETPAAEKGANPLYSLRKGADAWDLVFEGRSAPVIQRKGMLYIHYLLTHPDTPLHATKLVFETEHADPGAMDLNEPRTERAEIGASLELDGFSLERNLGTDDRKAIEQHLRTADKLRAIIEDNNIPDVERQAAAAELAEVEDWIGAQSHVVGGHQPDRAVRAVRAAIRRQHEILAKGTDESGDPHPVLRPFAEHIRKHIIAPSALYSGKPGQGVRRSGAGCFIYEQPSDVTWSAPVSVIHARTPPPVSPRR